MWTAEFGGVRWVCGFTDEGALARFAAERAVVEGAEAASRSWEYATFRGRGCWTKSFRPWEYRPGSR